MLSVSHLLLFFFLLCSLTSLNPWKFNSDRPGLDVAISGSGSDQSIIDHAVLQRNYILHH